MFYKAPENTYKKLAKVLKTNLIGDQVIQLLELNDKPKYIVTIRDDDFEGLYIYQKTEDKEDALIFFGKLIGRRAQLSLGSLPAKTWCNGDYKPKLRSNHGNTK